ncbi:MAG: 50S ribosomal protein L11 methyltransferase, partial [Candidatus Limnocylindrales bacterium]
EAAFELADEGLAARVDPSRPAVVRAYLPAADPAAVQAGVAAVERDLGHLQAFGLRHIGELLTRQVDEEDWAEAWKRHFPVLRLGRRLVSRPTWRRHRATGDEVVLALDPGMAFGTGLHPTTRLCLVGLERLADRGLVGGASVLDLGCGSGVLAIAAARLGATRVLGLDVDPLAVETTAANARRNRVARVVRAQRGSLPVAGRPFDLVLANLIASLLARLAADLYAAVRAGTGGPGTGGRLLASGIFADREPEVRRALAAAGFRIAGRDVEGDWVALEAERIDP